jgi:2-oxoglutarate dehydrogenase E1 component
VDVHPKLVRFLESRREAMATGKGVDWAFAEALAFGSLLMEGVPVRLSGEDSARGTFSQRHLVLHDDDTQVSWLGLEGLDPHQAPVGVIDSPLSEEAVLGFEYGYTIGDPRCLVLWEAQFGDFVNEAQVVIDQFLSGGEAKWGQPSGLVLLLPHGYEGQGPEHSSGRLERFLQVSAEDNLQVCNVTTPAQYFHLLRRQRCEGIQKPLIIMTPKSLLRLPAAQSSVSELTEGAFQRVIEDDTVDPESASRVVFSAGKVYYDLLAARTKAERTDVALVRVEQLYPFPLDELREIARAHVSAKDWVWCQEEPKNMGAWTRLSPMLEEALGVRPRYAGRPESASTASGFHSVHQREQARLVEEALTGGA